MADRLEIVLIGPPSPIWPSHVVRMKSEFRPLTLTRVNSQVCDDFLTLMISRPRRPGSGLSNPVIISPGELDSQTLFMSFKTPSRHSDSLVAASYQYEEDSGCSSHMIFSFRAPPQGGPWTVMVDSVHTILTQAFKTNSMMSLENFIKTTDHLSLLPSTPGARCCGHPHDISSTFQFIVSKGEENSEPTIFHDDCDLLVLGSDPCAEVIGYKLKQPARWSPLVIQV